MSAVQESFSEAQAVLIRLGKELLAEQERVRKLEQENEALREQFASMKKERDEFHKSICWLMSRDEKMVSEGEWVKSYEEAQKNPASFEELVRELEESTVER